MYIKLYEQWINEAQGVKLDQILLTGLAKMKDKFNANLMELSAAGGKNLEGQIRKHLDSLRNTYASASVWNNLNNRAGVEVALKNFKDLFFISFGGSESKPYSRSGGPASALRIKLNNALDIADGDFFYNITIDNRLWRSNAAVELKNIIVNGDEKIAKGLAASVILMDLSVALTNGMYFISNEFTHRVYGEESNNINLRSYLDKTLVAEYADVDKLIQLGGSPAFFGSFKDIYAHTYNTNLSIYKGSEFVYNYHELVPFIKDLTLEGIVNRTGPENAPPPVFFSPLFAGNFMFYGAMQSIADSVAFMKAGGPSLLQMGISKITKPFS